MREIYRFFSGLNLQNTNLFHRIMFWPSLVKLKLNFDKQNCLLSLSVWESGTDLKSNAGMQVQ